MRTLFWLKYKIFATISPKLWQFFADRIVHLRERQYRESKKTFGNLNKGVELYVIRRRPPAWGLFSNILFVIQGLIYAKHHSYEPVVDMENYWVRELSSVRAINNSKNAWCYFFEQTSQYSISEAYRSKNVILSDAGNILPRDHPLSLQNDTLLLNKDYILEFQQIINSHIRLNHFTSDFVEKSFNQVQIDPTETLGIFIRGTAYFNKFTQENFSTPDLDFLMKAIENKLSRINVSSIFLVTEDFRIYNEIREKFYDYKFLPSLRYKANLTETEWVKSQNTTRDGGLRNMGYNNNLIYLTEVFLLSKIKNFVGTYSNPTAFALGLTDLETSDYTFVLKNKVLNLNW